jgi:hypothetical protein
MRAPFVTPSHAGPRDRLGPSILAANGSRGPCPDPLSAGAGDGAEELSMRDHHLASPFADPHDLPPMLSAERAGHPVPVPTPFPLAQGIAPRACP